MKRSAKLSQKRGLPPGTLLHIGENRGTPVSLISITYNSRGFTEQKLDTPEEWQLPSDNATVSWLIVEGIHDIEIIARIGDICGLHPLTLEDVVNTTQRPKIEEDANHLFVVLKNLSYLPDEARLESEQINIICGSNYVITFLENNSICNPVLERIRQKKGRITDMGADYLTYALMDVVIDNGFLVLEQLEDAIDGLDDKLQHPDGIKTLREIHTLKRNIIFFYRAMRPLREVAYPLMRGELTLLNPNSRVYFSDLYDHILQVIDTIEMFRDIASGMTDTYLNSISNKTNQIMQVLTIIATIFIPLTFVAGIYGMNFRYMPELEWQWGYPLVLLVMLSIALAMLWYFRKRKWL